MTARRFRAGPGRREAENDENMTDFARPYRLPPRISMADAVRRGLGSYVKFSGRAPRAEFWKFVLVGLVAFWLAVWMDRSVRDTPLFRFVMEFPRTSFVFMVPGFASALVTIIFFMPVLSAAARRLHDAGFSALWLSLTVAPPLLLLASGGVGLVLGTAPPLSLLLLVFFAPPLILGLMLAAPSQPAPNRFEPNPLEVTQ